MPITEVARPFKTCLDQIKSQLKGYVEIKGTPCTGCAGVVATTFMLLLGRHGKTPEKLAGLRLFVGEDAIDDEGIIMDRAGRVFFVGDCVRCDPNHPDFIRGCPPTITQLMERVSAADVGLTRFGRDI